MEFLINAEIHLPHDLPDDRRQALIDAEGVRGRELAEAGHIKRLWRIPGQYANWGLWEAEDATALHAAVSSLPLWPYMTVRVVPLARHYADPAGS